METYPLDTEPEQVVRWIMAEVKAAPTNFTINARRTTDVRNIPVRKELHIGDEEREDLSEIATIATLEIAPSHASEGWRLVITVEDEAGPRALNVSGGEQRIDLSSFYHEFIRSGRGTANIVAEVEGPAAQARLTRLLKAIETNRPHPDRAVSRR